MKKFLLHISINKIGAQRETKGLLEALGSLSTSEQRLRGLKN